MGTGGNGVELEQIHHVAIISSNYERSKHFYVDLLGLTVIQETYRAERDSYKLDLRIGQTEQEIELFSFPNPPLELINLRQGVLGIWLLL